MAKEKKHKLGHTYEEEYPNIKVEAEKKKEVILPTTHLGKHDGIPHMKPGDHVTLHGKVKQFTADDEGGHTAIIEHHEMEHEPAKEEKIGPKKPKKISDTINDAADAVMAEHDED